MGRPKGTAKSPTTGRKYLSSETAAAMNPTGKKGPTMRTAQNRKEIDGIFEEANLDPARSIIKKLNEMEALYQSQKDTLPFDLSLKYFAQYTAIMERMMTYVYTKKAIEYKSEKTAVSVDYNTMIEQLNTKAFGPDPSKITDAIDQYSSKITNQVAKKDILQFDNEGNIEHE